jgi:hypothetical protein
MLGQVLVERRSWQLRSAWLKTRCGGGFFSSRCWNELDWNPFLGRNS